MLSLSRQPENQSEKIIPLLEDAEPDMQLEAARYLLAKISAKETTQVFESKNTFLQSTLGNPFQEQFALALYAKKRDKDLYGGPSSLQEW